MIQDCYKRLAETGVSNIEILLVTAGLLLVSGLLIVWLQKSKTTAGKATGVFSLIIVLGLVMGGGLFTPSSAQAATDECGTITYENCDAAKAANRGSITRGEPGYSEKLDRDNDGVACEENGPPTPVTPPVDPTVPVTPVVPDPTPTPDPDPTDPVDPTDNPITPAQIVSEATYAAGAFGVPEDYTEEQRLEGATGTVDANDGTFGLFQLRSDNGQYLKDDGVPVEYTLENIVSYQVDFNTGERVRTAVSSGTGKLTATANSQTLSDGTLKYNVSFTLRFENNAFTPEFIEYLESQGADPAEESLDDWFTAGTNTFDYKNGSFTLLPIFPL